MNFNENCVCVCVFQYQDEFVDRIMLCESDFISIDRIKVSNGNETDKG